MEAASITSTKPATGRAAGAWRTVWILVLVWTLAVLDRMILLLLIPGIKHSLGLSDTEISLLHGMAFAACFALAGIPLGHLADRWNRRNMLVAGLVGWSLATIACGFATSFAEFFLARMAVGISQAMLAPAAISMVADLFEPSQRGKPTALLLAASMFGGALSNVLSGGMIDWFTRHPAPVLPFVGSLSAWQVTLILAGIPGLLVAPVVLSLREPVREAGLHPATDVAKGFSMIDWVRKYPAMFALLFSTFTIISVSSQGVGSWYPAVFMRAGGMSASGTGALLAVVSLVAGIGAAVIGGFLSDRAARMDPQTGRLKLVSACLAGQFLTLLALFTPDFVPGIVVTLVINVILVGTTGAACYSLLPDLVPPQGRGLLVAMYQFLGNLIGFGLGPTAVALLTNRVLEDESWVADAMLLFGLPLLSLASILAVLAVPLLRRMRTMEG